MGETLKGENLKGKNSEAFLKVGKNSEAFPKMGIKKKFSEAGAKGAEGKNCTAFGAASMHKGEKSSSLAQHRWQRGRRTKIKRQWCTIGAEGAEEKIGLCVEKIRKSLKMG